MSAKDLPSNSGEKAAAPLLELDGISLRAGATPLLSKFSLRIDRGAHASIVGANGSGKSLLARVILGHVTAAGGAIRYWFDDSGEPRAWCFPREVALVTPDAQRAFARNGFHQARWNSFAAERGARVEDYLSASRVHDLNPFRRDLAGDESEHAARLARVLDLLDIAELPARGLVHLSDGEWRKVLIARALLQDPRLLILDDPYSGLDPGARKLLARTIEAIVARGEPSVLLLVTREDEIPVSVRNRSRLPHPRRIPSRAPAASRGSTARHDDAGSGEALVALEGVSIAYAGKGILHDIHWTVRRGENWLVTGANGAGKSTLLSVILADNPQAYGQRVRVFGLTRGQGESIWEIKRRIGWVSPELRNHYSGRTTCLDAVVSGFTDSIGLFATVPAEQRRAAEEMLDAVGIAHLAPRSFASVSVGEQRLVLLARALVRGPELLLLDEPGHGLDAGNRRLIHELLEERCSRSGCTFIYVSHHPEERPRTVTHHLALDHGRVVRCGPIE